MTRTYSMKDAAERLEKLPALLTHEGETPVVAVLRRGHPVLAVLPWDLYVGLLQALASLPEDSAVPHREGIRALLADATTTAVEEASPEATRNRQPHNRQAPHRRRGR
ncbi:MAG TPA: hypothetical protein VF040_03705 [Ktedonobacterales bacterium]